MQDSIDKWQAQFNICWNTAGGEGGLAKQLLCERIAGPHIITIAGLNKWIISAFFFLMYLPKWSALSPILPTANAYVAP